MKRKFLSLDGMPMIIYAAGTTKSSAVGSLGLLLANRNSSNQQWAIKRPSEPTNRAQRPRGL